MTLNFEYFFSAGSLTSDPLIASMTSDFNRSVYGVGDSLLVVFVTDRVGSSGGFYVNYSLSNLGQ